jgi:hypothetical protein
MLQGPALLSVVPGLDVENQQLVTAEKKIFITIVAQGNNAAFHP